MRCTPYVCQIDFEPADVDTSKITFADKAREKQRQRRLQKDQQAMREAAERRRAIKEKRLRKAAQAPQVRHMTGLK